MMVRPTAHDAARPQIDCDSHEFTSDEVAWLTARDSLDRPRARFPALRSAVALGVGLGATLLSAGSALGPAASARADIGSAVMIESALAPVSVVSAAPVEIAPDLELVLPTPAPAASIALHFERDAPRMVPDFWFSDEPYQAPEDLEDVYGDDPDEIIAFGHVRIPRYLVETILRAAEVTGVDPVYMLALADKESSFSPNVKAGTSSAEGLFQFISRTWLMMLKEHGPRHGMRAHAAAIEIVDGNPVVADEPTRDKILALRRDPYLSAVMAAEMLKSDRVRIEQLIGRGLNRSEYYLAHFFGVESAGRFMKLVADTPEHPAAKVFPAAAKANKTLFFKREGRKTKKLSVAEVYAKIDRMMDHRIGRYEGVQYTTSITQKF
jgi:hypothetical protein